MVDRPPLQKPMTPARLFRGNAFVLGFLYVVGFFLMAICDAEHDYYHFRMAALGLLFATSSLGVGTYLSVRRSWKGEPPADIRDGIIPAAIIFALGWGIWALAHI